MKRLAFLWMLPLFYMGAAYGQVADSNLLLLAKTYGTVRYFYPAENLQDKKDGWNNFLLVTLRKMDDTLYRINTSTLLQNSFRDNGFAITLQQALPKSEANNGGLEKGYYWEYKLPKKDVETVSFDSERKRISPEYLSGVAAVTDSSVFMDLGGNNWLECPTNPPALPDFNTEQLDTTYNRYQPIASIIELWAELSHFAALQPNMGWDSLLLKTLARLPLGNDKAYPLQFMLTQLNDGNATIIDSASMKTTGRYPIDYVVADEKVVVEHYDTNMIKMDITGYDLNYINNGYTNFRLRERRDISPAANLSAKDIKALVKLTEGPVGQVADVVLHNPTTNKNFRLTLPYSNAAWKAPKLPLDSALITKNKMAYFDMVSSNEKDIKAAVGDKNIDALVFDFRHCSQPVVDLLKLIPHDDFFAPYLILPTVSYPSRQQTTFDTIAETIKQKRGGEGQIMIFLADASTTGDAEQLMSIVKQTHMGYIIGGKTAGAVGVTTPFRTTNVFGGGIVINYTSAIYLTPGKDLLTGNAVEPDIEVVNTQDAILKRKDPLLLKAAEFIQAKKKFSNK